MSDLVLPSTTQLYQTVRDHAACQQLTELRKLWEDPSAKFSQTYCQPHFGRLLVVVLNEDDTFDLLRYFPTNPEVENPEWGMSCDGRDSSLRQTLRWLNSPSAAMARSKD